MLSVILRKSGAVAVACPPLLEEVRSDTSWMRSLIVVYKCDIGIDDDPLAIDDDYGYAGVIECRIDVGELLYGGRLFRGPAFRRGLHVSSR